jgi:hypothetical protein
MDMISRNQRALELRMEAGYWNFGGERSFKMGFNPQLLDERMNVYFKLNW